MKALNVSSLTPTEQAIIKAVEFVVFIALSAAVLVALPLINITTGTINWQNVTFASLFEFLLVLIFAVIEYLKQSIQTKLIAAEKAGTSTVELQAQLATITNIEGEIGTIVEHTKILNTLVPGIAGLISTAQQTATSALQAQSTPTTVTTAAPAVHGASVTPEVSTSTASVQASIPPFTATSEIPIVNVTQTQ
jgi:hypothetical protein